MNVWECDVDGCGRRVAGLGGAVGLRAIGWAVSFVEGRPPSILCPSHGGMGFGDLEALVGLRQSLLYHPYEPRPK